MARKELSHFIEIGNRYGEKSTIFVDNVKEYVNMNFKSFLYTHDIANKNCTRCSVAKRHGGEYESYTDGMNALYII